MSEPLIEHLIQDQTAAIAVLQRHITTREPFRLVLMDFAHAYNRGRPSADALAAPG
jgi:hypothetical protein